MSELLKTTRKLATYHWGTLSSRPPNSKGNVDISELPDAFKTAASEQEALLFSYETSKTSSNTRLNPTKAFKQTYKLELGSESLLSDANMAIATAGWRFIYSLGENDDHQFVGRSDFSYIFTDEFDKVPYNLRFFTGGDQTIRGFDYKSLSPEDNGYKIGGQALAVGSLEYNYQFKEGWRAAVFLISVMLTIRVLVIRRPIVWVLVFVGSPQLDQFV